MKSLIKKITEAWSCFLWNNGEANYPSKKHIPRTANHISDEELDRQAGFCRIDQEAAGFPLSCYEVRPSILRRNRLAKLTR